MLTAVFEASDREASSYYPYPFSFFMDPLELDHPPCVDDVLSVTPQFAAEALEIMESQRSEFARRRNYLVPALRQLGFDIPLDPAGAFYVYCGLPDSVEDSERFCRRLLETEFVAITPGTDFGLNEANRKVRISYTRDIPELEEALARIERALR